MKNKCKQIYSFFLTLVPFFVLDIWIHKSFMINLPKINVEHSDLKGLFTEYSIQVLNYVFWKYSVIQYFVTCCVLIQNSS
jgi:hypothetical protein